MFCFLNYFFYSAPIQNLISISWQTKSGIKEVRCLLSPSWLKSTFQHSRHILILCLLAFPCHSLFVKAFIYIGAIACVS